MSTLSDPTDRVRRNLVQFIQFGMVGGAGVLVNMGVYVVCNIIGRDVFKVSFEDVMAPLLGTSFNLRFYHLYSTLAFLIANMFNFVINRYWTFRSKNRANFWREYFPFLAVGISAFAVGLGLMTALINPTSPIALPSDVFDNSTGLRNKGIWANLIQIIVVTPINFVVNKLWTFRLVRRHHGRDGAEQDAAKG